MKWNQGKETGRTLLGKQGGRDDVSKLLSVDESESLFEDTLTKDLFIDKKRSTTKLPQLFKQTQSVQVNKLLILSLV